MPPTLSLPLPPLLLPSPLPLPLTLLLLPSPLPLPLPLLDRLQLLPEPPYRRSDALQCPAATLPLLGVLPPLQGLQQLSLQPPPQRVPCAPAAAAPAPVPYPALPLCPCHLHLCHLHPR